MSLLWFGQPVPELSGGFARVNLIAGESMQVRIDGWELGSVSINLPGATAPVEHIALGITGERLDKVDKVTRWSFTTRYLIDWLWPRLQNRASSTETYTLTVEGSPPVKISHALIQPAAA